MSRPFPFSVRRCAAGLSLIAAAAALAGCDSNKWGFPYIAGVQQGNWITSTEVSQLQVGMTRDQVRFLLGSPTMTSVLRADRWDYPYYFKPGYGQPRERTFTLWFDASGKLVRWEGDAQPEFQPYQVGPNALKVQNQNAPVPPVAGQPAVPAGTRTIPSPVKSVMLPITPNSSPTTRTASPPAARDTNNTQGGSSSPSSSGSSSSTAPASTTTP